MTRPLQPLAMLWLLASLSLPARADLAYFQKGGELQAPLSIEGKQVFIELPDGRREFRRDDFLKLVPGFAPEREWRERRQEPQAGRFEARYVAAWWAIENGLTTEVIPELRSLHKLDPKHPQTARMVGVLDKLDRPCSEPKVAEFRKALGVETSAMAGPHVLLLHQHSEAEATERIAFLERVITGYYLFFAAQGIELSVPTHRLVFGWLADQRDYLAFLQGQNASAFRTTRGYYHPTWNAVVAYDARSTDRQRDGRENAIARREELESFQVTVDHLPARAKLRVTLTGETARTLSRADALALIDRLGREVRREELLLDLERRAIDDGTAAHEMIHLLAAGSGLLPRHNAFPVWLQEGLAMQFEVIRGGRWAGIARAHDLRLPDWRKIQPAPRLEPLVRDTGFGRGYNRDLYAQAWSLVYYLRAQHPQPFLTFLDLLRTPEAASEDMAPSQRSLESFRRAFGTDIEALERDWHAFMSKVQTPLELHTPPAPARPEPKAPRPARRPLQANTKK
jgi:Protein of unknown function (DUF1570)